MFAKVTEQEREMVAFPGVFCFYLFFIYFATIAAESCRTLKGSQFEI